MNSNTTRTWPKDFKTRLPMVPPGEFTDFKSFPDSTLPVRAQKLPALRGWFDASSCNINASLPMNIGWGAVTLENGAVALTFRVQVGSSIFYWLANPADKNVWKVVDQWSAAGLIVLAADFGDGPGLLVSGDFKLVPQMAAMRRAVDSAGEITPKFVAGASAAIMKDEIKLFASTNIPSFPTLTSVQTCMVRTDHTRGVAVILHDEPHSGNGLIADAAAALARSVLRPGETRH